MYEAPGKVTIAPTVLTTIVRLTTLDERGVRKLAAVAPKMRSLRASAAAEEGIFVAVTDEGVHVEVRIVAESGNNMLRLAEDLQVSIKRAIEEMVGMPVASVDVHIDDVVLIDRSGEQG
jgi:uncharacterized alkaline shock family protein YloU